MHSSNQQQKDFQFISSFHFKMDSIRNLFRYIKWLQKLLYIRVRYFDIKVAAESAEAAGDMIWCH